MKALLIIDMQNDFMPGGALPVPHGDTLVEPINRLMDQFSLIVASKDWHPQSHQSFAENHPGKKVGEVIELHGQKQVLWPVHCVQDTKGSEFAPGLNARCIDHICYKGTNPEIDSYSAFFDNHRQSNTDLKAFLKEEGVDELHIVGVATDYCVLFTVLDAVDLGFTVILHTEGCLGIDLSDGDVEKALMKMKERGAKIV